MKKTSKKSPPGRKDEFSAAMRRGEKELRRQIKRMFRESEALVLRAVSGDPIELVSELKRAAEKMAHLGMSIALPIYLLHLEGRMPQDCGDPSCHGHDAWRKGQKSTKDPAPSVIAPAEGVQEVRLPRGTMFAPGSRSKS